MNKSFFDNQIPHRYFPSDKIDHFDIKRILGEGTFGVVYQVTDRQQNVFALKMLKLWEVAYEKDRKQLLQRFKREFDITEIASPYLVRGYETGLVKGNPYFTMDFCSGGSMARYNGSIMDDFDIDTVAFEVLSGLHELHCRAYAHRDLKPNNLLVGDEGHVRLADFGIAGHKTSMLTQNNIFVNNAKPVFGTWGYIAPEQSNNKIAFKAIDAVSDIFSFGVTMFELITGHLPFAPFHINNDKELIEYIGNVRMGKISGLEKYKSSIQGKWQAMIKKCLDPDFEGKRYQSVDAILSDLGYKSNPGNVAAGAGDNEWCLRIAYGDEMNKIYYLDKLIHQKRTTNIDHASPTLTMGRRSGHTINDIEITEDSSSFVSRKHATLVYDKKSGRWIIKDGQWLAEQSKWQQSVNGTYLNSRKVSAEGLILKNKDVITVGDTVLQVIVE